MLMPWWRMSSRIWERGERGGRQGERGRRWEGRGREWEKDRQGEEERGEEEGGGRDEESMNDFYPRQINTSTNKPDSKLNNQASSVIHVITM